MAHKAKHRKKPKRPKKPKKKDMAVTRTSFKLVVRFSSRSQTQEATVRAWFSPAESGTEQAINFLASTYDAIPGRSATVIEQSYKLGVFRQADLPPDDQVWEVDPRRSATIDVDDEAAFLLHMDEYYETILAEIQARLTSRAAVNRIKLIDWHLHFAAGAEDRVA